MSRQTKSGGTTRRSRPSQHFTLERQFLCFAIISTITLISYAIIHTGYRTDSSFLYVNKSEGDNIPRQLPRHTNTLRREYNVEIDTSNATIIQENDNDTTTLPFFTPVDEQHLHNGRVVRELSHRILSRNIAQSNVIIVSPNFDTAHVFAENNKPIDVDEAVQLYYPAKVAIEQGHVTHLLPCSKWHNSTTIGDWVLLAYFTTQNIDSTIPNQSPLSIDDVLSSSLATSWLRQTTITYIVFPIHAKASIPLLSIIGHTYEYDMDFIVDKSVEIIGLTAASTLLDSNYKLQLLSSSHYFDPIINNVDATKEVYKYGPNALFQSVKALHRFLYTRVTQVLQKEVNHVRQQHLNAQSKTNNDTQQLIEVEFHSLLFATQGLDLALPARSSYTDVSNHKECKDSNTGMRKKRCDPKLNARALNDTIFLTCPERHEGIDVQFVNETADISQLRIGGTQPQFIERVRDRRVNLERTPLEKKHGIMIDIKGKWLTNKVANTSDIELWLGDKDPSKAEAVCVKLYKKAIRPRVHCTTRVIPTTTKPITQSKQQSGRPNLLLIMIDPLSKQQLRRSLPNTWALLELLGYQFFPKFVAVGNNSGPNQAALYSGMPLDDGRQGIKTSSSNAKRRWLWDSLNDAGYVTMKAEDGCISNSNMVQSISPQTHHGKQLHEMFCQSYDRPNCLGSKLAAEHLIDYTRQFINTYDRGNNKPTWPWAAFVSFIDSHEDTLTLISYLDNLLVNFLQDVPMNSSIVVFMSDHGHHYGPSFASRSGETERAQPLLYMRLPMFKKNQLHQNQQKFTTAFDVHATLVDILLGNNPEIVKGNELGVSLLTQLPEERNKCSTTRAIPSSFCPLVDDSARDSHAQGQCEFMRDPPSVFSFFSSIPQMNRPHWPEKCSIRKNHDRNVHTSSCLCATNVRDWFDCSSISRNDFKKGIDYNAEQYSLRSCGCEHDADQSLELDIHVKRNDQVVIASLAAAEKTKKRLYQQTHISKDEIDASFDTQPNIIFLEIDSVSLSFSERHFPKTWSLLQQHKIVSDQNTPSCPTGWCAGVFNQSSVVGQSSIVNQLAALSGCIQYDDKEEDLHHYTDGSQTHCPSTGTNSLGVDNETGVFRDHWIFEVAKELGFVTFFGEEFCYQESPYVVQGQSAFSLDGVDMTLSELYCQLANRFIVINGITDPQFKSYSVEYDNEVIPDSCFDGRSRGEIGLEFISQIWDAYESQPKFAFLNALAAHDYSLDPAHLPLSAESYDAVVYRFLTSIMTRKNDSRDTYIILRSDHGLQGGPHPIDYSTQIEHMHPWTAIIAPSSHQSISISSFALNQNRLVTGFDLYNSIRYLMSPSVEKKSHLIEAGIPPWSYNLFRETIPANRNCKGAKIPIQFCLCIDERKDMSPGFYVGYSTETIKSRLPMPALNYDWRIRKFSALKLPGYHVSKFNTPKYEVSMNRNIVPPTCNSTLASYIDEVALRDSWQLIDNITSMYPGSDISGGIFLYRRQTILLSYLLQNEIALRVAKKKESNGKLEPFRVCETGFGSGHSTSLFLAAAPNVEVVSFDKFDRPYQLASFYALRSYFGKRLTRSIGDSCKTVKSYGKQCDFLHGSSLCKTDNIDLIQKAKPGVILTSTAMNSLEDGSVYFGGENAQWKSLFDKDCIENVVCFEEEETIIDSKLYLARGKELKTSHKFCIGTNTGQCSKDDEDNKHESTTNWNKDSFCPDWTLERPET